MTEIQIDPLLKMKFDQAITGQRGFVPGTDMTIKTVNASVVNAVASVPDRADVLAFVYNGNPPAGSTSTLYQIPAGRRGYIWYLQSSNGTATAISITITDAADVLKYAVANSSVAYTESGKTFQPCIPLAAGDKLKVYGANPNGGSYCIAGWTEMAPLG